MTRRHNIGQSRLESMAAAIAAAGMMALGLGGCAESVEDVHSIAQADQIPPGNDECTDIANCGLNAAQINGYSIAELDLRAIMANTRGIRFVEFLSPYGESFEVTVQNGELVALQSGEQIKGDALIGFKFVLEVPLDAVKNEKASEATATEETAHIPLYIVDHRDAWTWTHPDVHRLSAYALAYPENLEDYLQGGGSWNEPPNLEASVSACPGGSPSQTTAFVFAGEVYDTENRTVIHSDTADYPDIAQWMSIACAGSAAAKMKLFNYGPQADFDGQGNPATPMQRQATLKMITADYCGIGHSFTATGTPLYWENEIYNADNANPQGALEAIWNENGAECIEGSPLAHDNTQLRVVTYEDVHQRCGALTPPRCGTNPSPGYWNWMTYLVP